MILLALVPATALGTFRSIDSEQLNSYTSDLNRIAVDYRGAPLDGFG
jgi:hypothetical protein